MSLNTTIKNIQNIMRKDVGVDGDAQRISQLGWMLLLKIWDDRELELEIVESNYSSPLTSVAWDDSGTTRVSEDLRWRSWAADDEGMTGEELLAFVNDELFPSIREMKLISSEIDSNLRRRQSLLKEIFSGVFQYMKSGTLLRQVINQIENGIDFNDSKNRHLFGDIYEKILRELQSAGNAGEYYTPRAATQFAVDMINPKLGETILDPACGTGGFLTSVIEHIRKNEVSTPEDEMILHDSIRGVEKKPLPHLLCITNMILHGLDTPTNIMRDNTLSRPLRDYTTKDKVDVILTNPPFGGSEEDGIETNFPANLRTTETADLFLILIFTILRERGRAAVVLPVSSLFGDGVKSRIKEKLLTECNLHTIVKLPEGVFAPYTPLATNILFFDKGESTEKVWFFEHPLPKGVKTYSKSKPMKIEEFDLEKEWWDNRKENENAWCITIDQIREKEFNLDFKNPNRKKEILKNPGEILSEYKTHKQEQKSIIVQIKDALSEALLR